MQGPEFHYKHNERAKINSALTLDIALASGGSTISILYLPPYTETFFLISDMFDVNLSNLCSPQGANGPFSRSLKGVMVLMGRLGSMGAARALGPSAKIVGLKLPTGLRFVAFFWRALQKTKKRTQWCPPQTEPPK